MSRPKDKSKILTKNVQSKFAYYFNKLSSQLYKAEIRCVKDMILGILKSQRVFINQIATHINDKIDLKQTTKRFRNHYNKEGFWDKLISGHLSSVASKVNHGDYMLLDLSDIQKKYAKFMEGLDYVKDGNSDKIGLGYWLMNIISINKEKDMVPLYNKLYSFACGGTLSENKEIIKGIDKVSSIISKVVTWVIDRGGARPIIISYFIKKGFDFIIRLKKNSKLIYKGIELAANQISRKVKLKYNLKAVKVKKNKIKQVYFTAGATKVEYNYKGELIPLWFVVTKRVNGGYAWFLFKTDKEDEWEVIDECFEAYGFRWKIEEYHRHIKNQYHLEQIQIQTFAGLQTMLSVITVTMYLIYREIRTLHEKLILESGIKTVASKKVRELVNYIYYKIGNIIKNLFANVTARCFLPDKGAPPKLSGQLILINFEI